MRRILTVAASTAAMLCLLATASAHAEEAPPAPIEPQVEVTDSCRQWLDWLVDGNFTMFVRVTSAALNEIARECLGREAHPTKRHPVPGKSDAEPAHEPEPTADRLNI